MEEVRKRATTMRRVIAKNMVNSWHTSPKCDYVMEIDAEPIIKFRKKYNDAEKCNASFLSIVMKAAAKASTIYPMINSRFDMETMEHIYNDAVNIGFVLSVENGLLVLNVKNTDKKAIKEISESNDVMQEKNINKKLSMDDMTGGSLTINNMGGYSRLEQHSAIINQPELCILSMYRIKDVPVVREGQVVVGKRMKLVLSADHRVVDGKLACDFLDTICSYLENPEENLL